MGDKGLGMSSIAIKSDSEQSDSEDKIEVVNVKNGKPAESGQQRQ
jgi:hypothetical protein